MKLCKLLFTIIVLSIYTSVKAQGYEPKKVPSFPRNISKLAMEIHDELKKTGSSISVFDREIFALDANDPNTFEFFAHKKIGKSGERSVRFLIMKGEVYYARLIDEETAKVAQGILYEDMADKWQKYLDQKERDK